MSQKIMNMVVALNVVLYILVFVYCGFYEISFFYYMYIFKMGKTIKEEEKKEISRKTNDGNLR